MYFINNKKKPYFIFSQKAKTDLIAINEISEFMKIKYVEEIQIKIQYRTRIFLFLNMRIYFKN